MDALTPSPAEQEILDGIARDYPDRIVTPDDVERLVDHIVADLPEELHLPLIEGLSEAFARFPDRTPDETAVTPAPETVR